VCVLTWFIYHLASSFEIVARSARRTAENAARTWSTETASRGCTTFGSAKEVNTARLLLIPACGLRFDHLDLARGNQLKIKCYKKGVTGQVSLQTRIRFGIGQFYQVLTFAQSENLVHKIQTVADAHMITTLF
jgi:hypothetical protein